MTRRRPPDPIDGLLAALEAILARPATPSDERLFRQYLDLFVRWNRVHRMTALESAEAIVRDLFIDSLLFFKALPTGRPLALVDIGAGGGIPGLPMRIADAAVRLTLVEARRKRISFLRAVCRELDLEDVVIVEGRAEEVVGNDPTLSGAFDVAVSRAVGRIERLRPIALPYLKPGGRTVISAAPGSCSSDQATVLEVPTPEGAIRRFLVAPRHSVPRGT